MMDTPICDFVREYASGGTLRLHMPGHKGAAYLGAEKWDITEIGGADELYHARGIIRKSEENASSLFGTGRTLYSTEGSSLCIRAMLYLALLEGRRQGRAPVLLAGRNAHKTLMTAAALLDVEIEWLPAAGEAGLLSCRTDQAALGRRLARARPMAVYVTSPDYLGNMEDIAALAALCHRNDVPLLVDNAHGAYLRFLPEDRHPITLGADMCCDSAHKTLPCLTGAAYLHIAQGAPALYAAQAERALALFASTSPSYLILQSLDTANRELAAGYRQRLAVFVSHVLQTKARLQAQGFDLHGDEPMKITLAPKAYGYTGEALHALLRELGIECEFADPDWLVMMPAPDTGAEGLSRLEEALRAAPRRAAIAELPPPLPRPMRACSIREAMLAPQETVPIAQAQGRILADAHAGCPPAVPILVCGEVVDDAAIRCFRYYGKMACNVVADEGK